MSFRTRVKICGVRDAETARVAADAGADAIGLVFVPGTPRFVEPDDAAEIMFALPPFVTAVGVVRDLSIDDFSDLEQKCPCPLMQLHGDEADATVSACGPGVVKAIAFEPQTIESDLRRWSRIAEVDAVLVDGPRAGSGETIDWHRLAAAMANVAAPKPLILAGGLTAENVGDAISIVRPFAVDVSSGVEADKGVKDPAKIAAFCAAVRRVNA